MSLPDFIWHLRGPGVGPNVVILGGTHGDELTGIEIVRRLLKAAGLLSSPSGAYEHRGVAGGLSIGFGNPEAILRGTRGASDGPDLNRSFAASLLNRESLPEDPMDLKRARELAPLLADADYFLDLHATSSESPPFLCLSKDAAEQRAFCRFFPVDYVLVDCDAVISRDLGHSEPCTTDTFVTEAGGQAVVYETGWERDLSRLETAYAAVIRMLRGIGAITDAFAETCGFTEAPPSLPAFYELAQAYSARKGSFAYAPGMDRGWQEVKAGQRLGTYPDGEEEQIPEDGMLLFPKGSAKIRAGKNLYYLAKRLES